MFLTYFDVVSLCDVEKFLPLTGAERKKYLVELKKNKNLDGRLETEEAEEEGVCCKE
jgi:hypothetical protein